MSYTLSLFRAAPGVDVLDAARRDWQDEEADPDPIVELSGHELQAIADELCRLEPDCVREKDSDGIDIRAPDSSPRLIPDYEVFTRGVLAYLPGDPARPEPTRQAARETLAKLGEVARMHGLAIYDPQRDALVDPRRDVEAVAEAALAGHAEAARRTAAAAPNVLPNQAVGVIVLLAIVMVAIQLGLPEEMRFYGMLAVPIVLFLVALMMLRAKATPRR
ncbi:MAG TPA: hypothetical protein VFO79_09805 [Xanthomonadales bacterium]|nr:hypothetical protein [Xanthomonadales bacterium]